MKSTDQREWMFIYQLEKKEKKTEKAHAKDKEEEEEKKKLPTFGV